MAWTSYIICLVTATSYIDATCPAGFKLYPTNDLCCGLITSPKDFLTAELDCQSLGEGGTLVKVTDLALHSWIKHYGHTVLPMNAVSAQLEYWIGVNDIEFNVQYSYNDGTALTDYTLWGTLSDGHDDALAEGCVMEKAIRGHIWLDAPCSQQHQYICQVPSDAAAATTVMRRFVVNPAATSTEWALISNNTLTSTMECSLLCVSTPLCAAFVLGDSAPYMPCVLLQQDKDSVLTLPPGTVLYEWVPA